MKTETLSSKIVKWRIMSEKELTEQKNYRVKHLKSAIKGNYEVELEQRVFLLKEIEKYFREFIQKCLRRSHVSEGIAVIPVVVLKEEAGKELANYNPQNKTELSRDTSTSLPLSGSAQGISSEDTSKDICDMDGGVWEKAEDTQKGCGKKDWSGICATSDNRNQCSDANCVIFPICKIKSPKCSGEEATLASADCKESFRVVHKLKKGAEE